MNDKSGERRRRHDVVQLKIIVQLLVQYKKKLSHAFWLLGMRYFGEIFRWSRNTR